MTLRLRRFRVNPFFCSFPFSPLFPFPFSALLQLHTAEMLLICQYRNENGVATMGHAVVEHRCSDFRIPGRC